MVDRRTLLVSSSHATQRKYDAEAVLLLLLKPVSQWEKPLTMTIAISGLLRPRYITRPSWVMAAARRAGGTSVGNCTSEYPCFAQYADSLSPAP
jgi:hypothetical protein